MVRILTAAAISLMMGVLPASAQGGGGGCKQWCLNGPCAGGGVGRAPGSPVCMNQCVAKCQQKQKSK
jgi:hypothetical protein